MYSLYLRERIVRLSVKYKGKELVQKLNEEGFKVSISGCYYVLKKYRQTRSIFDRPRSGRPSILPDEAHQLINQWLTDNDELTTNELLEKLRAANYTLSRATAALTRYTMVTSLLLHTTLERKSGIYKLPVIFFPSPSPVFLHAQKIQLACKAWHFDTKKCYSVC